MKGNRGSAEARLSGLMRKLNRDAQLRDDYDSVLQEWEQSGVTEEVAEPVVDDVCSDDAFYRVFLLDCAFLSHWYMNTTCPMH